MQNSNIFASSTKQFLNDCLTHLVLKKHLNARSYVCIRLLIFTTSVLPFFCVFVDNQCVTLKIVYSIIGSLPLFRITARLSNFFLKENLCIADVAFQKAEDRIHILIALKPLSNTCVILVSC